MVKPRILIVGANAANAAQLEDLLRDTCSCSRVVTVDGALEALRASARDAVIVVIAADEPSGIGTVRALKVHNETLPVIVATRHCDSSVEGILRAGAYDYIPLPTDSFRLHHTLQRAMEFDALVAAGQRLKQRVNADRMRTPLVGNSPVMENVREKITLFARTRSPILITGEPGTGKRMVARQIHDQGPRAAEPFVVVSCTVTPSVLMEDEIFGTAKDGAPGSGGKFAQAHGGTLLIDGIGNLKRPLQDRHFDTHARHAPVGGVRLITTA